MSQRLFCVKAIRTNAMQHQNILSILLYGFGLILALSPVSGKYKLYKQISQRIMYRNALGILDHLAWQRPLSNGKQAHGNIIALAILTHRRSD